MSVASTTPTTDDLPSRVKTFRIAMWSGPRNISTAMMRSFDSRADAVVCDEPLYAHYLQQTRYEHHPGYAETLAGHETDWRKVVDWLVGPLPAGKTIFYQKQMAQHLLPHIDRTWIDQVTSCFLIRDPYEMLTSLIEFLPNPRAEDTGLPQQWALFEHTRKHFGTMPPVLDSHDVLDNPRGLLTALCAALGISFCEEMLHWQPGLRSTDGAWAPYWYKKVAETTGFSQNRPPKTSLPDSLRGVLAECQVLYDRLYKYRLT